MWSYSPSKEQNDACKCRWYKQPGTEETQKHILSECQGEPDITRNHIEYEKIFDNKDLGTIKDGAAKIRSIINFIKDLQTKTQDQNLKNNQTKPIQKKPITRK